MFDDLETKHIIYNHPEYMAYLREATRNHKYNGMKIYVGYGSPMWCAYRKAQRELEKQTLRYKMYKVKQAFRVLVKICFREWFKIRL